MARPGPIRDNHLGMQLEDHTLKRFPLAGRGKWNERLMIPFIFLFVTGFLFGGISWLFLLPGFVLVAVLVLGKLYAIVRRSGDYIELLPDGIVLAFAVPLWNFRIPYETIVSVELKDRRSDRTARALLSIVGRSVPPGVELRFRRRVNFWWAVWPRKRMYLRPADPETFVAALLARLGAT